MRELKRGEIKQILLDQATASVPEFAFLSYKNNCYTFQRQLSIEDLIVYELLHVHFSLKEGNFSCSVASRLNKALVTDNNYNTGMINPHTDLIVLKKGTGALDLSEAYYYHDGKFETIMIVVREIFKDFRKYGLDLLNKQLNRLLHNQIIKDGLSYLRSIPNPQIKVADNTLREKLQLELKGLLFAIEGQTREDRKEIVRTARELIDLYWDNQKSKV